MRPPAGAGDRAGRLVGDHAGEAERAEPHAGTLEETAASEACHGEVREASLAVSR
jgi:hypothetical protein